MEFQRRRGAEIQKMFVTRQRMVFIFVIVLVVISFIVITLTSRIMK